MACGFRREAGRYTATATTRFLGAKARVGCRVARVWSLPAACLRVQRLFLFPAARAVAPSAMEKKHAVSSKTRLDCERHNPCGVYCPGRRWGAYTSGTEFCLSCHEMRVYQDELKLSPHAKDADGKPISCSQCHIPSGNLARMLGAKAWLGVKDLWVHNMDGGEDLDRAAMQPVARRFTDDANCRACHQDLGKNAKNDGPISKEGKLAHDNYEGKNGQARSGCVGCHRNLGVICPPLTSAFPLIRSSHRNVRRAGHEVL